MTRVGWIGVGAMGGPMAECVAQAGYNIKVFDVDAARAAALSSSGAKPAATIAEVVDGVDVVALMVATAEQADSVLWGDGGAAESLAAGSTVVIMATVGPAAVKDWASQLASRGVDVVDAPVSGGVARAGAGDLLIMVGGPEAAVERVRPLLETMARTAPFVGSEPGAGQKIKLVNQLLCGVHIAAAAEALAFAEAMDLDARSCWEILRDGAAASFMLDDRGARMVEGAFDEPKSALDIFVKDMGLVTDAGQQSGASTPLAGAAQQLYLAGRSAGLGRLDDSSIIEVLRRGPEGPAPDQWNYS